MPASLSSLIDKTTGPHRAFFSFAAGSVSCIAMAPNNFWPVLIPALSLLYILVEKAQRKRAAFFYGWLFGFGYFLFSLFWIKNALMVEGNPYAWAWPLAVCGLPCLLAFFPALGMLAVKKLSNLKTIPGFLSFTAWLALAEFARGFVFTGFPWNLLGYTWAGTLPMIQIVAVGNIYFLTWLTILWFSWPGFLLAGQSTQKNKLLASFFILASFALCMGFGAWRLQTIEPTNVPGISFHIIQPNISQSEKWDRQKVVQHFEKLLALSRPQQATTDKTIIVWPETAVSSWILQDPQAMRMITDMLDSYESEAVLLTGYLRHEAGTDTYHNSLVMVDKTGAISNIYDKHHLVPFGEYIPFQKWIPLRPVVEFTGFRGGDGPHTFAAAGIKYSPVICYETIFSGALLGPDTPDVIINITNDAWYGFSAGPHQHFTQAVFRAVEEGIPVIRVANTGITALIDPYGKIHAESSLYTEYEKNVALPVKNMLFNQRLNKNIIFMLFVFSLIILEKISKRRNSI